jgi:hypothetical protein
MGPTNSIASRAKIILLNQALRQEQVSLCLIKRKALETYANVRKFLTSIRSADQLQAQASLLAVVDTPIAIR